MTLDRLISFSIYFLAVLNDMHSNTIFPLENSMLPLMPIIPVPISYHRSTRRHRSTTNWILIILQSCYWIFRFWIPDFHYARTACCHYPIIKFGVKLEWIDWVENTSNLLSYGSFPTRYFWLNYNIIWSFDYGKVASTVNRPIPQTRAFLINSNNI